MPSLNNCTFQEYQAKPGTPGGRGGHEKVLGFFKYTLLNALVMFVGLLNEDSMGIWNLIYIYICEGPPSYVCWFINPMKTSSLYLP